jgi:hypothetical protein
MFALLRGRNSLHIQIFQPALARLTRLPPLKSESVAASIFLSPFPTIKGISLTVVPRLMCRMQLCRTPTPNDRILAAGPAQAKVLAVKHFYIVRSVLPVAHFPALAHDEVKKNIGPGKPAELRTV